MKTTLTTFYGGQHARRFKSAARLRGERKKLFRLFQIELTGKDKFYWINMKTTLTTFYGGQHARRFKSAARLRGERKSCSGCFK